MCVLTGDKTAMASVEQAARHFYAAKRAENKIPPNHPQREELEQKQQEYDHDFTTTILSLFDKLLFPIQRPGREPQLVSKTLETSRDTSKPFDGEEQILKTVTKDPIKLYVDIEKDFDSLRCRIEDILWPENQDEARWIDILDRYREKPAMPWLPPNGLETLKAIAISQGLWEDLGNGYITKNPKKKKTSVQVIQETQPDDDGFVRLRVNPQNAGPAPKIYYEEDGCVSEKSKLLEDQIFKTNALRVQFLAVDPSGQFETGDPVLWTNKLVLRNRLSEQNGQRVVELFVAPRGEIRYTLDGSEPREGLEYNGKPIPIGDDEVLLRVFAEAEGLETKEDFRFPPRGKKGIQIDPIKPVELRPRRGGGIKLDSRAKTFEALSFAMEKSLVFEGALLTIGSGRKTVLIQIVELEVKADYIKNILEQALKRFEPDVPVTLTLTKVRFNSGHDLEEFIQKFNLELKQEEIIQ